MQHEDNGLEQSCFGLRPERVRLMAAFGRGRLDQRVHQLQRVLFIPQVAEGVITIGLLEIHKVQHPDVIALLFQITTCCKQDFGFRVGNDIICVCL